MTKATTTERQTLVNDLHEAGVARGELTPAAITMRELRRLHDDWLHDRGQFERPNRAKKMKSRLTEFRSISASITFKRSGDVVINHAHYWKPSKGKRRELVLTDVPKTVQRELAAVLKAGRTAH